MNGDRHPARFAAFWSMVGAALDPGGRACFVDSSATEREDERAIAGQPIPSVLRRLRDGSEHRVVKVFYTPSELEARLTELGWTAKVHQASVGPIVGSAAGTAAGVPDRDQATPASQRS
jgi:hypothetical protein